MAQKRDIEGEGWFLSTREQGGGVNQSRKCSQFPKARPLKYKEDSLASASLNGPVEIKVIRMGVNLRVKVSFSFSSEMMFWDHLF